MNHDILNAVRDAIIKTCNEGGLRLDCWFSTVAEFQQFVIAIAIRFLCNEGLTPQAAYDRVFGDGSFTALADEIFAATYPKATT